MFENKIKRKTIKFAILGDTSIGKTAIISSFLGIEFSDNFLVTIGREKNEITFKFKDNNEIKLIIWDSGGVERFGSIALGSLKNSQGIILVFDLIFSTL